MNNYKQAAWTVPVVVVQQKPRGPTTTEPKNTEGDRGCRMLDCVCLESLLTPDLS